jgi:hypothetical protein
MLYSNIFQRLHNILIKGLFIKEQRLVIYYHSVITLFLFYIFKCIYKIKNIIFIFLINYLKLYSYLIMQIFN